MMKIGAVVSIYAAVASSLESNQYIEGIYSVKKGFHYSNKSSLTWGENNFTTISASVSMSPSCATYNCSTSCSDTAWYLDWNKLWGKVRCGYLNGNHDDSDRFVWRRCSDPTCDMYISGKNMIQLGAYRYKCMDILPISVSYIYHTATTMGESRTKHQTC